MLTSPNLSLQYIDVNEAQREVVHNAAVRALDALVQLSVLDRDLATPPGSPSDGERWLVAASPTGAWAGHATHIAAWQDGAWRFYVPQVGWLVFVTDEGALLAWNGSAWVDALSMITSLQNMTLLGVGTTADTTNPFSAKLNNTLWVAKTVAEGGDGNLRYKLSKESSSKTLSMLFQDNFSGRAEIGLTGDDDFHFKVSPDGTSWFDSLILSSASGQARMLSPLAVRDSASYASGVGGTLQLQAMNASASAVTFASLGAYATTGTAGSEVGDLVLKAMKAGTLTEVVRITGAGQLIATASHASVLAVGRQGATAPAFQVDSSASSSATGVKVTAAAAGGGVALAAISSGTNENLTLDGKGSGTITFGSVSSGAILFGRNANPMTSDGAALGATSLMWSDLFLASGAVINFNNGDVTITHSTDLLTVGGGDFKITNSTASTSSTTGALVVTGGIGAGGNMYVAGHLIAGGAQDMAPLSVKDGTDRNMRMLSAANWGYAPDGLTFNIVNDAVNADKSLELRCSGLYLSDNAGILTSGSPTGGLKGGGTLNAKAVYDDNTLLTCFGVEFLIDGAIDVAKWDGYSPAGRNDLVRKFAGMVESFDPRDPRQYIAKMFAERALPGMPSERDWRHNELSIGSIHNHLWLSTELLAAAFVGHVENTDRRLADLESRLH